MAYPRSPDFSAVIAQIAGALSSRDLPFMLFGGQAVLLHGEPRLTQDIDISLGVDPSRLPDILAICDELGLEVLPDDIEAFVQTTFVVPARHTPSGIRLDVVFSTTPYEAQAIARAVMVMVGGVSVPFACAEDLIVHKLFAGRPRDIEDAKGVVHRKGAELDWGYMNYWIEQFAEVPGREDLLERLEGLRQQIG